MPLLSHDAAPSLSSDLPRFGILGGTFDPVHAGHVQLAQAAIAAAHLTQVVWLPTPAPPHKTTPVTPWVHRLAMVQAAIAPYPQFTVSPLAPTAQSSYAIALWQTLRTQMPPAIWLWIMGLDTFATLPRWYRGCELITQCQWLIAPRSPAPSRAGAEQQCQAIAAQLEQRCHNLPQWQLLDVCLPEISSRQLRHLYRDRPLACPAYIDPAVHAYIQRQQLYQADGTNVESL